MSAPQPLAQGNLATTPLAHVVLSASRRKLSGTLAIWPDGERPGQDRILLQDGVIIAGKLLDPAETLERGLLPLFQRKQAPYAFYDVDLVGTDPSVLRADVAIAPLVAAALRGGVRDDAVAGVLGGFGPSTLRIANGADLAQLALTARELAVTQLIQASPSSADEIVERSGDEKTAKRVLYLLGLLSYVEQFRATQLDPGSSLPRSDAPPPPRPSNPGATPIARPSQVASRSGSRISLEERRRRHGIVEPVPPPPPPAGLPEADAAKWADVVARFVAADKQTYFQLLDVSEGATGDAARDAYFALAKIIHPDRLPPSCAAIRPYAERLFLAITEARDTLVDDQKRMAYLRSVKDGGGTPESDRKLMAVLAAAHELDKANVLVNMSKWTEALDTLAECKALDPTQIDAYALEAWVLFNLIGQDPAATIESVMVLCDRTLADSKDGYHERALSTKALCLKKQGKDDVAVEIFRKISQKNPRNLDAAREVRLYEMRHRGGKSGETGKIATTGAGPSKASEPRPESGLLSRLFGDKKPK